MGIPTCNARGSRGLRKTDRAERRSTGRRARRRTARDYPCGRWIVSAAGTGRGRGHVCGRSFRLPAVRAEEERGNLEERVCQPGRGGGPNTGGFGGFLSRDLSRRLQRTSNGSGQDRAELTCYLQPECVSGDESHLGRISG